MNLSREIEITKTLKYHTCHGCGMGVLKGQSLDLVTGVFEESWYSYRICETCKEV